MQGSGSVADPVRYFLCKVAALLRNCRCNVTSRNENSKAFRVCRFRARNLQNILVIWTPRPETQILKLETRNPKPETPKNVQGSGSVADSLSVSLIHRDTQTHTLQSCSRSLTNTQTHTPQSCSLSLSHAHTSLSHTLSLSQGSGSVADPMRYCMCKLAAPL